MTTTATMTIADSLVSDLGWNGQQRERLAQFIERGGRPATREDLRAEFRAYVKAKRYRNGRGGIKSYREITEELGGERDRGTLRLWMQADCPKVFKAMSKRKRRSTMQKH